MVLIRCLKLLALLTWGLTWQQLTALQLRDDEVNTGFSVRLEVLSLTRQLS